MESFDMSLWTLIQKSINNVSKIDDLRNSSISIVPKCVSIDQKKTPHNLAIIQV